MSATIVWQTKKPKSLPVDAPSRFLETMGRCFGELPIELTEDDIPKLTGMSATCSVSPNPYEDLINILYNHRSITLWAEY